MVGLGLGGCGVAQMHIFCVAQKKTCQFFVFFFLVEIKGLFRQSQHKTGKRVMTCCLKILQHSSESTIPNERNVEDISRCLRS